MSVMNYGIYYGYSRCCIKEFMRDLEIGLFFVNKRVRKQRENASKNGFVPCRKHARMINAGKINIESLIQNRKCTTPF